MPLFSPKLSPSLVAQKCTSNTPNGERAAVSPSRPGRNAYRYRDVTSANDGELVTGSIEVEPEPARANNAHATAPASAAVNGGRRHRMWPRRCWRHRPSAYGVMRPSPCSCSACLQDGDVCWLLPHAARLLRAAAHGRSSSGLVEAASYRPTTTGCGSF